MNITYNEKGGFYTGTLMHENGATIRHGYDRMAVFSSLVEAAYEDLRSEKYVTDAKHGMI